MSIGETNANKAMDDLNVPEDMRDAVRSEGRIRGAVNPGWTYSAAIGWAARDLMEGRTDWDRFTKANQAMIATEKAAKEAGQPIDYAASYESVRNAL